MIPIAYNIRSLAVRRSTTLATTAGMALVVFVFSSVLMLANGLERTMARAGRDDVAVVLRKGADAEVGSHIEAGEAQVVAAAKEIALNERGSPAVIGEVLVVVALDKIGTDGIGNVAVRGVPDDVADFRDGVKIVAGRAARPGTDEAIVGAAIRGRFAGLDLDRSFQIGKDRRATVVGVFADEGSSYESEVWLDREVARDVFAREGLLSALRVRLVGVEAFDAFATAIAADPRLTLQVQRESQFYAAQSENTMMFIRRMGLMIATFFAVGATIGAMITMHSSVAHRRTEIGILRALGFRRAQILVCFVLESMLLSLFAGSLGALASLAMQLVRFSTTNFVNWSEIVFTFEPTPGIVLGSLAFATAMGMLGGLVPALRAARVSPLAAMRG